MSGRDERPKSFNVMIENRPYMTMACGACYRNMEGHHIENNETIDFTFTCPMCGHKSTRRVLKSEIERIQESYEITED